MRRFSRTVILLKSRRFSGTIDTPRETISLVLIPLITSPSSRSSPLDGSTMPRMVFSVVVLPEAFPPNKHTISPGKIFRSTFLSTWTGP